MLGRGLRENSPACSALCWFSVTSPTTHNQIGHFWSWFSGGWVCVRSRTLWVSPVNSPVRLGVSPTAASTPTGVFNKRFEALFPCAGTLGCVVCLAPQLFLPVYLHMNVGLLGLSAASSLGPPAAALTQVLSVQLPVSVPPTGLDEYFLFNSLVVRLPYHTVRFSVSPGSFLFLNLLLSFFWLCKEEARCVYLHLHLGQMFQRAYFPKYVSQNISSTWNSMEQNTYEKSAYYTLLSVDTLRWILEIWN